VSAKVTFCEVWRQADRRLIFFHNPTQTESQSLKKTDLLGIVGFPQDNKHQRGLS